jgi:6,7-dimethyl-8-ribityllumazine synthase
MAKTLKALIIEARFYEELNDMIVEGAKSTFAEHKIGCDVITVPGALEIPAALNMVLQGKNKSTYDMFVVAGCVIRGETGHYDIVVNESARGVYDLVYTHNLALGNVILTVENRKQAESRANPLKKNKGGEAAHAAIQMHALKSDQT